MTIAVQLDFKGGNLAQYDEVIKKMGFHPGGTGGPGLISHWVMKTADYRQSSRAPRRGLFFLRNFLPTRITKSRQAWRIEGWLNSPCIAASYNFFASSKIECPAIK